MDVANDNSWRRLHPSRARSTLEATWSQSAGSWPGSAGGQLCRISGGARSRRDLAVWAWLPGEAAACPGGGAGHQVQLCLTSVTPVSECLELW